MIGNGNHIQKQGVVGALRAGILDGDSPMDAVPLAHEDEVDALLHQRRAVPADGDDVLEIGDSPALGDERRTNAEHSDEKKGLGGAALQRRNQFLE